MRTLKRIYLPLSKDDLTLLDTSGELDSPSLAGYGVTDALAHALPNEDHEGLEFAALQDAATASGAAGSRILVAAADVEPDVVSDADAEGASSVTVRGPLPLRRIVSLHLGDEGDDGSGASDVELSWYDVTELALVRDLV